MISRIATLALTAFLGSVAISSSALAQTATLEVLAPDTMVPSRDMTTAGTQYDVRINYAFAGGDVVNPKIVVDLPPGVIIVDLGSFPSFSGNCNYHNTTTGQDAFSDWICTFTSSVIQVPSGGVTGQIPIRVRVVPYFFVDDEQVTLSATLTADNAATVSASDVSTIDATYSFVGGFSNIAQGWTRKDTDSPIGSLGVYQSTLGDYNGTGYAREGAEMRFGMPTGTQYLGTYSSSTWSSPAVSWTSAESFVMTAA